MVVGARVVVVAVRILVALVARARAYLMEYAYAGSGVVLALTSPAQGIGARDVWARHVGGPTFARLGVAPRVLAEIHAVAGAAIRLAHTEHTELAGGAGDAVVARREVRRSGVTDAGAPRRAIRVEKARGLAVISRGATGLDALWVVRGGVSGEQRAGVYAEVRCRLAPVPARPAVSCIATRSCLARPAAALRALGQKGVRWTFGTRPGAVLGHVTVARRRAAGDAGVPRRVLTRHAAAVALVEGAGVGVGGACGPRGLLCVGACRARPRAGVGDVTLARRRAARDAGLPRRVLTRHAAAVALVEGAGVGVGGACGPRGPLRVGARRARPRAGVGDVTLARRRAAGGAGVPRRVLTRHARAVALVEGAGVGVGGACRPRGLLRVGARRARPRAGVGDVTLARRRAAGC